MSLGIRRLNKERGEPMPGEGHRGVNSVMAVPKQHVSAYSCRVLRISPNGSTAMHDHQRMHVVIALTGKARVETRDEVTEITPGMIVNIPSFVPHRFVNASREDTALLVQNLFIEESEDP
ncbi:MAG: cupin domain-containing protein [Candidatus Bathyarchaeota archaeon]|nr:cupin domain-containing protein [Candidatus Bathyarchaeota archaeon]